MAFRDDLLAWRGRRLQKEAAAALGIPVGTYRKWEYGKRTPDKFKLGQLQLTMALNPDQTK